MRRLTSLIALAIMAPLFAQEPPMSSDLVGIDVQVVDRDGRPITGLTAAQFEVAVGGKVRQVESARFISAEAPPAGDTAASASSLIAPVEGRLFVIAIDAASVTPDESLGIAIAAQAFVDRLSNSDRVGILTYPSGPRVDATTDRSAVRDALGKIVAQADAGGAGPFKRTLNALGEVLQMPLNGSQRKVIVFMTAGAKPADGSAVPAESGEVLTSLSQQAAASNAAIYTLFLSRSFLEPMIPRKPSSPPPALPPQDDDALMNWLAPLMEKTGGAEIVVAGPTADAAVSRLLSEVSGFYRLAIVVPEAEQAGPMQPLVVNVRDDTAVVRARNWLGTPSRVAPAAAPAAAALPRPPSRRAAVVAPDSIPGAYERAEYASVRDRLEQTPDLPRLIRTLRDAGELWPDAPRRSAMFALEVATVALNKDDPASVNEAVALLVQQGGATPASDAFQCAWYWAGLMLFQSTRHSGAARPFISQALARCPDEPRVILADAVIADQSSPVLGPAIRTGEAAAAEAALHESVIARYRAARQFPETAAEAQVREAWLQFRLKRFAEALRLTETLPPFVAPVEQTGLQEDLNRQVLYISHFVRGVVLRELRQFDNAAAAFRQAAVVWPYAQSARVALMTLLAAQGQRGEAERIAAAIESTPSGAVDPWWWFWQGDHQLYTVVASRLRELAH